jgi:TetR/AcrR family transcriptional regulator, repressor for uid operon
MEFGDLSPQSSRVLDAALTCIGRVGLTKTTLDDVAREAGCARATVYRCFSNKQQLLRALVAREAAVLRDAVLAACAPLDDLGDAATAAAVTAATFLAEHDALGFICEHEPDVLLPYLAFEHEDAVLLTAAALVAPAFSRFLEAADAERLGEWLARTTLSYLFSPSDDFDITDAGHVRALVGDFIVPGFFKFEGVSR